MYRLLSLNITVNFREQVIELKYYSEFPCTGYALTFGKSRIKKNHILHLSFCIEYAHIYSAMLDDS
jgi:hypothetical protein